MHIIYRILLIIGIFVCTIYCQGARSGGSNGGLSDIIDIIHLIGKIFGALTKSPVKNKYKHEPIEILDKNTIPKVKSSNILLILCIVILVVVGIWWYNTCNPSNTRFVNAATTINDKKRIEDLENIFQSGNWMSNYLQYNRWRGPHTYSLFFNHQKLKVTGSGTDDVGTFSIDGIYSYKTCRIGLRKIYYKGTGNPLENCGHKVIIQLEWNEDKRHFEGNWYVNTNRYCGQDKFILKFSL